MSKKGVSKISGNPSPVVGEKTTYMVTDWYPATSAEERNPAVVTWELFKKRPDGSFTTTNIKKVGDGSFTFGEVAAKNTYRLEAYLHQPEGKGSTTIDITPQQREVPKINKVELRYADDSPGTVFSYQEKLVANAQCVNLAGKKLLFTLWEDDAAGEGHNSKNKFVDSKEAVVSRTGTATAEFILTKALMQKASKGERDPKELEFYVTVEYYRDRKHASENRVIKNPEYKPPIQPSQAQKSTPKATGSPAASKPDSKKETSGVFDSFTETVRNTWNELWDWAESKGAVKPDKKPTVPKPEGKTTSVVNGETKDSCLCKETKLFWGKHFTCQERKKIIEISHRLGCKPDYLTSAMALETGGTFNPAIVNSLGYTGLIQIGTTAAADINRRKGTNVTAGKNGNLKNMTKLEQLTYVEYYLEPYKGKLNTLADFYLAILMPVDCGRGNERNHVVFDKNLQLDYDKNNKVIKNTKWVRQKAYQQNPAFFKEGKNETGRTYVWEIAEEIEKWYNKGEANAETSFLCQKSAAPAKVEQQSGKWHDPVDNPRLTKYNYGGNVKPSSGTYGWCRRNSNGSKKYHSGFDFFAIPGKDKVYATLKGNIHQVRYSATAGWIVRVKIQNVKDLLEQEKKVAYKTQFTDELKGINIKETDDVYFIYMHLDSVSVTEADANAKKEVDAGTVLGYAGVSGSIASGGRAPHLHLEVATVLDAYGKGESVRTNPARFVKLNSYDTKDQDEAAKINHTYKK
ncbi:M23 family metallopeptidase [Chryseobacterium gambrini]|uniref:M23 family metallopeptidase n=1 Tax=Chryseobacterium gambrini TaxID=373672 RepID=A0AAJ1R0D7_9FLAO|nr:MULTISPECIES: M23 family metallopeptidase [Chryseobacterium]MDN4011265.1 M23 family metallopeptidase [Chryseobacterium gambrini]QWA38038.1 peptidoglycan DD-metalloendopeptidase family protein [Chryseobacterium sp. ZHDP1]